MSDEYLEMCEDFTSLILNNEAISGNAVFEILKKYSSTISIFDMMAFSSQVMEENKYVQENYREDSQKSYIESFLYRVKDIPKDTNDYSKNIDKETLGNAVETLKLNHSNEESERKNLLIFYIASFYATFILEEPIHPVGTPFPGSLKVEEKDGKFLCPVRDANIDTPKAVCNMCRAEQLDF
ncbi:DUF2115 family protein [Methanobrevibacter sp.]|uniref:DUF2115 family protein n=1 Tax=Methanobrevibacter sp. TaxID=66852 RepID=UPI00388D03DA